MNILLVTPAPLKINNGNKITAVRWAGILKKLGHRVRVKQYYDGKACELLIALHARRSYDSIKRFRQRHPELPLIVVLTGTDLYRDIHIDPQAQQSLELASRLVALQRLALRELPKRFRSKTQIIYQSAEPMRVQPVRRRKSFKICVIGHLREEKDPLRIAMAVRNLPRHSRIQVTHIGEALDEKLAAKARAEAAANSRYLWLGQFSHNKTRAFLARSDLVCITSKMEGSSNVLSEALASGVPVVCSKIPGLVGTLGQRFAGYFPVGNHRRLRSLLLKSENDPSFYRKIKRQCRKLAALVKPQRELAEWRKLLGSLSK